MNNIHGLGNSNVNWSKIVDSINTNPLANIGKASFDAEANALTIVTSGENARKVTISIPELQAPMVADSTALDAFVAKLSDMSNLALSHQEMKQLVDGFNASLGKVTSSTTPEASAAAEASTAVTGKSGTEVFFDIFQLMALMMEVAQHQRDAAREIRTAESLSIQKSIQMQAQSQMNAAVAGMACAICVGVLQIGAQGFAMYKSAAAHHSQQQVAKGLDVKTAQTNLHEAKADLRTEQAKLTDLQKIDNLPSRDAVPNAQQNSAATKEGAFAEYKAKQNLAENVTLEEAIGQQETKVQAQQQKVADLKVKAQEIDVQLNADETFKEAAYNQAKWRTLGDIFGAIGSTAQGIVRSGTDIAIAEATREGATQKAAEEELEQTKDLFAQAQDVIRKVLELADAISNAESQSVRDAIHV